MGELPSLSVLGRRARQPFGVPGKGDSDMARAIWSGAISFGLVTIPVKLYTAVSRKSVKFNLLDAESHARLKQKRVSSVTGDEVPWNQTVKGYEITKDTYIVIEDGELDALAPEASRTIDITDFVLQSEIDPLFYDSGYHLVPDEIARKPYALLSRALEESGQVAIASFVMRTKQYLAAIRPEEGRLVLSTMIYADELVDPIEIGGLEGLADIEVSDAELTMANQLIETLAGDFTPEKYEDTYREQVLELIERKSNGEVGPVEVVTPAASADVVDLMAALEASVAAAKEARKRHPTAQEAAAGDADELPEAKTA